MRLVPLHRGGGGGEGVGLPHDGEGESLGPAAGVRELGGGGARRVPRGGVGRAYKFNPVMTRSLKAPGFNPCTSYEVKNWFQSLLST
jgi:hypothetical protein